MSTTNDKDSDKSTHSDSEENYDDASTDIPPEGQDVDPFETDALYCEDNQISESINDQNHDNIKNVKSETSPDTGDILQNKTQNCELSKYFYLIGNETYVAHAQEPWPQDVKLYQPHEVEQILLPDNANCLAVQAFLKMCQLNFQIEPRPNAEFMSPTGKVPFIKCGAFLIAELEGIVTFVGQKGISLTEHLDPEQKADLRAYQALINNVLGAAENYVCWCDRETYKEVTKPRNGSVYPWPLNLIQTWSKRSKQIKALKTLGWHEKTLEEVFQEVETCCQALSDRLENNMYFFGDKFTELDALMYGHIYCLLTSHLPVGRANFTQIIHKFDNLVNHCKRIDAIVMERETDFDVKNWVEYSKSKKNKLTTSNEDSMQEKTDQEVIGDFAERETDWLVIDKKADVDNDGDVIVDNK